jgi:hypothetical protein
MEEWTIEALCQIALDLEQKAGTCREKLLGVLALEKPQFDLLYQLGRC